MTSDQRRVRVAKAVRRVLSYCARKGRKRPLDELDEACLDLAAEAQAVVLILDARMKHGKLSPTQAEAYAAASRDRDGALAALNTANPYRARPN